mgnify:CR=1 FL=1
MSKKKYNDVSYTQAELIVESLKEHKSNLDPQTNKSKINEINVILKELDNRKRLFEMITDIQKKVENINEKMEGGKNE